MRMVVQERQRTARCKPNENENKPQKKIITFTGILHKGKEGS